MEYGEIPKREQRSRTAWEEGGGVPEGVKVFLQKSYKPWTFDEFFLSIWKCLWNWNCNHAVENGLFCKNSPTLCDAFCNFDNILALIDNSQFHTHKICYHKNSIFCFYFLWLYQFYGGQPTLTGILLLNLKTWKFKNLQKKKNYIFYKLIELKMKWYKFVLKKKITSGTLHHFKLINKIINF